jgi:hypothetical protein
VVADTLADRYERAMPRLTQITEAGYQVEVQWECDFDEGILYAHPELKKHPFVRHGPLNTRDALYMFRNEAMTLHNKIAEEETIQYVDVVSLYLYIANISSSLYAIQ